MATIVVTGVSGYIGGQTALQLLDAGHNVLGIDRRELPEHLKPYILNFQQYDINHDRVYAAIKKLQPDNIVHCAGTSLVDPSIRNPEEYYYNNFVSTKNLVDYLLDNLSNFRFIYSSSAAVYGESIDHVFAESHSTKPISPYGQSKLMTEWLLASYNRAYNLDYVALRYFNACGADPSVRHGQAIGATHIIAQLLESILYNKTFTLYGTDYDTVDGTCIRDYVHVYDIARAHIHSMSNRVPSGVYNIGSNHGTSNKEIIAIVKQITGQCPDIMTAERRGGDPAVLIADCQLWNSLGGSTSYTLKDIVQHAWAWYNK